MAIKGRLSEMSLPTLIQATSGQGGQARLRLACQGQAAVLYFEDGDIVHTVPSGENIVYQVLAWSEGEFDLEFGVAAPEHSIAISCSTLLLDGLQFHDELAWDQAEKERLEARAWSPETLTGLLRAMEGQVPGLVTAAVLSVDGQAAAEHSARPVNARAVHLQMAQMCKLVHTLVAELERGTMEDYVLTARHSYLLLRLLRDRDWALGLVADRDLSSLGDLRLQARQCAELLDSAMFGPAT